MDLDKLQYEEKKYLQTIEDKKEWIVNCYCILFDKELAYKKADVTEEEKKVLEEDEDFQSRLLFFLIKEREEILTTLKLLQKSSNDKIAYSATVKRGELLYDSVFKKEEDNKDNSILPIETQKAIKALLESNSIDVWKLKIKEKLLKENKTLEEVEKIIES